MARRYEALVESNSTLKDANAALKELVNSLKNERAMLLEKNKALEMKLALKHLKQANDKEPSTGDGMSRVAPELPHAVLLNIFRALILPWDEYNTSVAAGPRNQWLVSLNTRTACILVCKHWYSPASQALYSDIILRRMGQILALVRTLRSMTAIYAQDRSRFIRSICINECILLPAAATIVKEDLTFLLHQCTNLRTFALRACTRLVGGELTVDRADRNWVYPTWWWDTDEGAPGSALAARCATSLEELTLADPLLGHHMGQIDRLLSVSTNLRKLVLGPLPKGCDLSEALSALPRVSLSLATLEDLQLPNTDDAFRTYIQEVWAFPALQRLTLVGCKHFPQQFLETHGANLKYLHLLYNGKTTSSSWSELELLEYLCPVLEHLVLPYMPMYSPPSIIRSPSLCCLDLWGLTPSKRRVVELMLELGQMCGLPSLRQVRILLHHDEGVLPAGLPFLCYPEDVDEDDTRVRVFSGVYILQTSWALLVRRYFDTEYDGVVLEEDPWADSASDMLYQCEEDAQLGDEDEGSEEEDELDTASEDDEGEEDEADSTAAEREEEGDERRQTSERKNDNAEGKGSFTREELLKRFCESQREDFIFDEE
ncbi:hypothetical protein V8D89_007678 [Ganoderma adspersum]